MNCAESFFQPVKMQPFDDGIFKMDLQDLSNLASPVSYTATAFLELPPSTHDWAQVLILCWTTANSTTFNWPVECNGAEAEHGGRAEELVQELEGLAEDDGVKPPAAAGAGAQCDVEGDAHQAGADPRARHVLHKAVGHRLEDLGAAGAPQHCGVSCGEGVYRSLGWSSIYCLLHVCVCGSILVCVRITVSLIGTFNCVYCTPNQTVQLQCCEQWTTTIVAKRVHANVEQEPYFHCNFFCTMHKEIFLQFQLAHFAF